MSWFKVDDSLWGSPKWLAATPQARALWVAAGSWCMAQLTDGQVPAHVLGILGGRKKDADTLVAVGLWERSGDGYAFHDWLDYQPTAAEIAADKASKHEAKVKAGRIGGLASGVARRKHTRSKPEAEAQAEAEQNEAPSHPGSFSGSVSDEPLPPLPAPRSATEAWAVVDAERTWLDDLHAELDEFYGGFEMGMVKRAVEMVIGEKRVANPVAYVMAAVRKDPTRYGPTPTPRAHPLAHLDAAWSAL